jgi:serine/threonine protein phosphatase 1
MRTLVVGDIHGGLRALEQVLDRLGPGKDDNFIFLGDYVDGWSHAAQTIDFLIDFSQEFKSTFIRGNHDELAYNYLKKGDDPALWLAHGGEATRRSYQRLAEDEVQDHIAFFEALVNYYEDEQKRLFVHAGFSNLHGPKYEYYPNSVYWDRSLWEMACAMDPKLTPADNLYPNRLRLFREIYIGHTPVTRIGKLVPVQFANVWNIDTGAAFKGPLSVMDVESKQLWQSDPVHLLYPHETGRN